MLNKFSSFAVVILIFFWTNSSWADGPYMELKLGANSPSNIKGLTQIDLLHSLNFSNTYLISSKHYKGTSCPEHLK